MVLDIEYPYSKDWKKAYLVTNSENRRTVILYNSPADKSSTQYARYLLAIKLGRYLTDQETVDHIDGDKTNDSLENLQILSKEDNINKSIKKLNFECICPICGKAFVIPRSSVSGKVARAKIYNGTRCCSRECGYKQTSITLTKH